MDDVRRTLAYLRMLDGLVVEHATAPRPVDASLFVAWFPRVADAPGSAATLAAAVAEADLLEARCVHASAETPDGTAVARILVEDGPLRREFDARLPAEWSRDVRGAYVCAVLARSDTHEPLRLPDGTPAVLLGAEGRAALENARAPRRFPAPAILSGIIAVLAITLIVLSFLYG